MKAISLKLKLVVGSVVGCLFLLGSTASWAYCTPATNGITYGFSVPDLSIPRDTPIGTEVYSSNAISLGADASFSCESDSQSGLISAVGSTGGDGPSLIGDSGLGWRLWVDGAYVKRNPQGPRYTVGGPYETNRQVRISLYKMGEISSVSAGVLGSFYAEGRAMYSIALLNPINPTAPSCETPSIIVNLGSQYVGKFKGVGSIVGEKSFNIQLNNCPAGINSISYRLDPVNAALDAKNGILALDPGGATGVGIKITDSNGAAVGLGQAVDFLSTVAAGSYTIPLKAAYYKSSDTVVGGAANASMQFTITYE